MIKKKKKKKKNPWNYVHISQYTRSHWPTFSASAKYSADRRKHQVLTASEQTIRYDDKTQTVHAGSFKYASWKSHWRPITTQVKDWTAKKYVSVALYMGPSQCFLKHMHWFGTSAQHGRNLHFHYNRSTAWRQRWEEQSTNFSSRHLSTHFWTFSSSHFQNRLLSSVWTHLRGVSIIVYLVWFHAIFPASQDWFQPITADVARQNYIKDVRRRKQTERESSLSYLQPSAWIFLFSHSVAAQDALPTQNMDILHPGYETQLSTIFVVHLGRAGTNPTDSTFNFISPWINMMRASVIFDHRCL